jgi:phosphatidylglycerol---prolipoprotein diacylglyceryl transferase
VQPWLLRFPAPVVGEVAVSSYFFWLILGCVLATEIALREARRSGESPRDTLRLSAAAILGGLVGARLLHVVAVAPERYLDDPMRLLRVWEGGMVFYGGFLGGLATVAIWSRVRGPSFQRIGDIFAAPLMMGLAFGRVGCLSAGCCYGRPIDWGTGIEWPWGITFLGGQVPSMLRGIPLHPTQAYAAVNALVLLLAVTALRRRQRFDGQVMWMLVLAYGVTRSVLELFRLDLGRQFVLEEAIGQAISTSQAISIPLILVAAAMLVRGSLRTAA